MAEDQAVAIFALMTTQLLEDAIHRPEDRMTQTPGRSSRNRPAAVARSRYSTRTNLMTMPCGFWVSTSVSPLVL